MKDDGTPAGLHSENELLDWYQKFRKKIEKRKGDKRENKSTTKLTDVVIWLPDFFHLGTKLLFDGEVPPRNKGALVAALAYVISPIDLIPDNIPVAGWIDDVIVMVMGLNSFLDTKDPDVLAAVKRHWAGDGDVFERIKHVIEIADEAATFVPKRLMTIIKGMFPKAGGAK